MKRVIAMLALSLGCVGVWGVGTTSGGQTLCALLSTLLRISHLGQLHINPQAPLLTGLSSDQGAYQDAQAELRVTWRSLKFRWPRYRSGTWHFATIDLEGLKVQLAPSTPSDDADQDWLTELSQSLHAPPSIPNLTIEALRIRKAEIRDAHQRSLAKLDAFDAALRAKKQELGLSFQAKQLDLETIRIDRIEASADWHTNFFRINTLQINSGLGHAHLSDLSLTPAAQTLAFEALDVALSLPPPYLLSASLQLSAPQGQASGELRIRQGSKLSLQSKLGGQLADLRNVELQLEPSCAPCGPIPQSWQGEVQLYANAARQRIHAQTQLRAQQQQIETKLRLEDRQLHAQLAWNSENISKLFPSARGQSQGQANCQFLLTRQALSCQTKVSARDLYPNTKASGEVELNWTPQKGLDLHVQTLALVAFKQKVEALPNQAQLLFKPDQSFELRGLTLQTKNASSKLQLNARRDAQGELRVQARAKNWELALLSSLIPGLNLRGKLELKLELLQLHANLSATLRARARRVYWNHLQWGNLSLAATQNAGRIRFRGQLQGSPHAKLELRARIPTKVGGQPRRWIDQIRGELLLQHLDQAALVALSGKKELAGQLEGSARIEGNTRPRRSLELRWNNAAWQGERLGALSLNAQVDDDRLQATLNAQFVRLQAQVALQRTKGQTFPTWDRNRPLATSLEVKQFDLRKLRTLLDRPDLPDLGGRLNANIELSGLPRAPKLKGWASVWRPSFRGLQGSELNLSLRHQAHTTHLDLAAYRGKGRLEANASIPFHLDLHEQSLTWKQDRHHALEVTVAHFDASMLAGIATLPPSIEANATLKASGTRHEPRAKVNLQVTSRDPKFSALELDARAKLSPERQTLSLKLNKQDLTKLFATVKLQANLETLLRHPAGWTTIPAQLKLRTKGLTLSELAPWVPASLDRPAGELSAKVQGSGPLANLSLQGQAKLRNGALTILPLQQRWTQLSADLKLNGQKLSLTSLSAKTGPGTVKAQGQARLSAPYSGSISLQAHRVPLSLAGAPDLELSSRLQAKASIQADSINVDTTLAATKVEVFERYNAAVKDIPTNPNIRFASPTPQPKKRRLEEFSAPPLKFTAKILDPLRVEGQTISTAWTGKLALVHNQGKLTASGSLRAAPRGSFDLLNNHFVLDRAKLDFSASHGLTPFVDVRAQTQVEDQDITVTAQGRADDPTLHFESSPSATKSEILSALVTGNTERDGGGDSKLLAKAASALIAEHTKGLGQIAKRLGVDNLRVSFGDSLSDTIVSAGTWIRPRVYLESRVRAQAPEGQSRVQGRVRFNFKKNWVLEGYVGDRSSGGGGVWWHRPSRHPTRSAKTPVRTPASSAAPLDPPSRP